MKPYAPAWHKSHLCLGLIFTLSFTANVVIALYWPRHGGDWDSYGTVAENILSGHGVSLSKSLPYEPCFGGNSFPGYPAFIAFFWLLSGKSDVAVRIAQGLFFSLSVAFFSYAIDRLFKDKVTGDLFGVFTALSPLTVAWSRSLQVEALSMSSTMLFFGILLIAIEEGRVRVIWLSAAILLAVYLRTDGILLFVPLLTVLVTENIPFKQAMKGVCAVIMIVMIGVGIWFARNVWMGMENIAPPPMLVLDKRGHVCPAPPGYLLWGWTWMSKEYERGGWGFPVTRTGYDSIFVPETAYGSQKEKTEVQRLLNELKRYTGQAFPTHIDEEFKRIALDRMRTDPFKVFVVLPLKRAIALWFHPGSSAGWPLEMDQLSYEERTKFEQSYLAGGLSLLRKYPLKILGKSLVFSTTLVVYLGSLIGLILIFRSKRKDIGIALLSYFIIRTAFYALTNNVESRYMSQLLPLLQFLTVYTIVVVHARLRSRRRQAHDEFLETASPFRTP